MNLYLYKSNYPVEYVNKSSSGMTSIGILAGNLVEATSVISPSIEVVAWKRTPDTTVELEANELALEDVMKCNYAEITEFNRKYFVNNIVVVNEDIGHKQPITGHSTHYKIPVLVRLDMQVDVLATYKDAIMNQIIYVNKTSNETYADKKLDTGWIPTKSDVVVAAGEAGAAVFGSGYTHIVGLVVDG